MNPTITQILNSASGDDFFVPGSDFSVAQKHFQKLLRSVHPDLNSQYPQESREAFVKLNEYFDTYKKTLRNVSDVIHTDHYEHRLLDKRFQSDNIIFHDSLINNSETAFIVYPNSVTLHTQFLDNAKHIIGVRKGLTGTNSNIFPLMRDSFYLKHNSQDVPAVVFSIESGVAFRDMVTLRTLALKHDMSFIESDVIDLYKRILNGLDSLHFYGFIHGGAYVDAFMVSEDLQSVIMKDFQYICEIGKYIQLSSRAAQHIYYREVVNVLPVSAKTDISLISKAFIDTFSNVCSPEFLKILNHEYMYPQENINQVLHTINLYEKEK